MGEAGSSPRTARPTTTNPTKVSVQQKPAGVLGFHRWGSNKSISLLHITHSTISSKIRIINVTTGSAKRQQRRGQGGSPGVVDSFGLLLLPVPFPASSSAKATVPKWGILATRRTPRAYVGPDVRSKRHRAVAQRLPWRRSRGPPATWGSARRAPRAWRFGHAPCCSIARAARAARSAPDPARGGRGRARPGGR